MTLVICELCCSWSFMVIGTSYREKLGIAKKVLIINWLAATY
jgi:hypothetical protein